MSLTSRFGNNVEPSTRLVEESVNGPRKLILVVTSILAFAPLMFSSAANVYITQNGISQGSCQTNPQTAAWFNSSSNWGSGGGQIGPGTTVLLCGTITTALTAQGSGSISAPITIMFDTGAAITLPVCPSSGCLKIANLNYIVVDGGTTCGWVGLAEVNCNGTISSTASGSAYGNGSTSAFGVEATSCSYCEIRDLNIINIYQHTSSSDTPGGDFRAISQGGNNTVGATFEVHNNIIHDSADGFDYVPGSSNDSGMYYYNNYSYNMGAHGNIANNNNGTITAAYIHDNYFGSTANWDSSGCFNHHNSFHVFSYGQTASGIMYYNNEVAGNWGNCPTSEVFFEGSGSLISNVKVFNNLFLATYTQENNGIISLTAGGTNYFLNNTVIGAYQGGDAALFLNNNTGGTWTAENNVISSSYQPFFTNGSVGQFTTMNYNTWGGTSGTPWGVSCSNGCTYYASRSAWQNGTGLDANSNWGNNNGYVAVNSNGTLQSDSPAIGAGTNLTSLGITALNSDIAGNSRPGGSTPWDDGAYDFNTNPPPAPPTDLTAIVN
jgi:hypothetical protein